MRSLYNFFNKRVFYPPLHGNLGVWFDAADESVFVKDSSDKISQWDDKGGRGSHATQATSSKQPLYVANVTGGKSVVRFDGAEELDLASSAFPLLDSPVTGFIVSRQAANGPLERVLSMAVSGSTKMVVRYNTGGMNYFNNGVNTARDIDNTSFNITRFIHGSGSNMSLAINSGAKDSDTSALFGSDATGIRIGAGPGSSEAFHGDIAEIIIYDRELADAETRQVEQYLFNKWGEHVDIPTGYTYTPPFNIYRLGSSKFTTDFDMDSKFGTTTTLNYWVDIATGDDSNAGTEAAPFKSIKKAMEQGGGGTSKSIFIAAGDYDYDNSWQNTVRTGAHYLYATGGRAKITTRVAGLSWVNTTGDIYKATKTHTEAWGSVYDASNLQYLDESGNSLSFKGFENGDYMRYNEGASATTLTSGEYFISGNDLYVRCFDDRAPDNDIRAYLDADNGKYADTYIACENIDFEGGDDSMTITQANSTDEAYFKNCTFKYSVSENGLVVLGAGLCLCYECAAAYSFRDGCNYHKAAGGSSGQAVEIDCVSRVTGDSGGTSNNGSSVHDAYDAVRVNCHYHTSQGPVVNDVGTSKVWMLGCSAHGSTVTGSQSFNMGLSDTAEGWYDSCDLLTGFGSENGANIASGATANFHNTNHTTGTHIKNGTVNEY